MTLNVNVGAKNTALTHSCVVAKLAAPAHMSKTKAELERDVAIAMQSLRDYEDRLQSKGGAASAVSDAAALGAVLVAVLAVVFASWALLRRP